MLKGRMGKFKIGKMRHSIKFSLLVVPLVILIISMLSMSLFLATNTKALLLETEKQTGVELAKEIDLKIHTSVDVTKVLNE